MVHHGDEQVEQDDDVDDGERAEHDQAPEPRELLDPGELKVVQVDQTEGGPEQGLACFPKTENLTSLTNTQLFRHWLCKFPVGKAVVDLNDNLVIFLHLEKWTLNLE